MTDSYTLRNLAGVVASTSPDGAVIRELGGHSTGLSSHSLALIRHPAGTTSTDHHHRLADEIYFVSAGQGRLLIDGVMRAITAGDIVQIRPGQHHKLWSDGPGDLELIVTCAPAHAIDDVVWDE
jgi:mannose-6-phosphate isomerase-like protein (cupin superfamily)